MFPLFLIYNTVSLLLLFPRAFEGLPNEAKRSQSPPTLTFLPTATAISVWGLGGGTSSSYRRFNGNFAVYLTSARVFVLRSPLPSHVAGAKSHMWHEISPSRPARSDACK